MVREASVEDQRWKNKTKTRKCSRVANDNLKRPSARTLWLQETTTTTNQIRGLNACLLRRRFWHDALDCNHGKRVWLAAKAGLAQRHAQRPVAPRHLNRKHVAALHNREELRQRYALKWDASCSRSIAIA